MPALPKAKTVLLNFSAFNRLPGLKFEHVLEYPNEQLIIVTFEYKVLFEKPLPFCGQKLLDLFQIDGKSTLYITGFATSTVPREISNNDVVSAGLLNLFIKIGCHPTLVNIFCKCM